MDTEELKELYITQACREAQHPASVESEATERIDFWQSVSTGERMAATWEITRRVYLASGGRAEDLKLDRSIAIVHRSRE